jgi:hypothetical protein
MEWTLSWEYYNYLLKKFSALCETWRFIIVYKRALHLFLIVSEMSAVQNICPSFSVFHLKRFLLHKFPHVLCALLISPISAANSHEIYLKLTIFIFPISQLFQSQFISPSWIQIFLSDTLSMFFPPLRIKPNFRTYKISGSISVSYIVY